MGRYITFSFLLTWRVEIEIEMDWHGKLIQVLDASFIPSVRLCLKEVIFDVLA